jgi:hypothetical protein
MVGRRATITSEWCAIFYRIHLLALETVTIAAYYAWFGYFELLLGDGHADDITYFNEKAGSDFSAFGGWVFLSTFITAMSHIVAFVYVARNAFKLAHLHYGGENPEVQEANPSGGFDHMHIASRYAKMSSPHKKRHDKLWSNQEAIKILSLMGTCPSVFAWDRAAKVLIASDESAVWVYCAGICIACVAVTSTICIATTIASSIVRCCRKEGPTDQVRRCFKCNN